MTNENNLSDLEIKLINASRKFASENLLFVQINSYLDTTRIILKNSASSEDKFSVDYSNNAENKLLSAYVYSSKSFQDYKKFLEQEIPEIKDRIKIVNCTD